MPDNICTNCRKTIKVAIFKGTGYCSVNCKKAAGIDHVDYGKADLMLVSRDEAAMVEKRRRSLAVRNGQQR